MKTFYTLSLLVALLAVSNIAQAQDYDLYIEEVNGDTAKIRVENILEFAHVERADENVGWTSLGYCLYGEDLLGSALYSTKDGDLCCEYYVEVQTSDETPGLYRLVNPYSPDVYPLATEELYSYDIDNNYYMEINATDPEAVYIEYQDTGMSWGSFFGRFYVYCMALWCYEVYGGYSWAQLKEEGYFGTLTDGVITFPQNTLASQFKAYGSGYFLGNTHGRFCVDTTTTASTLAAPAPSPARTTRELTINLNNLLTAEEVAKIKAAKQ